MSAPADIRGPEVLLWEETAAALRAELVFGADMECFEGHFPGFPVLAGVVQLDFVRRFARRVFADYPDAAVYTALKFRRLILPGRRVTMKISRLGAARFSFSLEDAGGLCTSGAVEACP